MKQQNTVASVLIGIAFMGFSFTTSAQKQWSLEECINYAIEKNLSVKRSELNLEISAENLKQSKYNALPTLNANANNTYNFGQTIDPFTNRFATQTVRSNSFGVQASLNVFNGFQTINSIKSNQLGYEASMADLDKMKNDISLNVANSYLQTLFNIELLRNAESQLSVTQVQKERIVKLVAAGSQPQGAQFDIEAQMAQEELNRVNAENQLNLSLLNLKQLLRLEASEDFAVVEPQLGDIEQQQIASTPGAIYENSLSIMPEIKGSELRLIQAEQDLKRARGGYSPRLTVNGSFGTGYSGASQEVVGLTPAVILPTGGFTAISNEAVLSTVQSPILQDKSFNDQLDDNLNSSVGMNLSIPIFNGLTSRTNVSRSKIQLDQAENTLLETKQQLRQQIESAYLDANAALKRYESASSSVKALNESFKYTQQRFNVGLLNSFDFSNEKNRLIQAESSLLQAKYEFIFKTKVLEFYQGKTLSLK
tara:strand:- start:578 stop:2017 length:1440 start_codon:yes stop_codon:yes gene_type:complete